MITQDKAREYFRYDPISGELIHNRNAPPKAKKGDKAGSISKTGYRYISIQGKLYKAHQIIWVIQTGFPPEGDIDHIDRNRLNNSWENLRECSRSQNLINQGKKPNSKQKFKGVVSRGNSHLVRLRVNGIQKYFGSYASAEEAARVYDLKAVEFNGEFALTNKSLGLLHD